MRRSHHAALFCATALVFIGLFLVPPKSTVAFSALDTTQRGARGIERAGLFVRETTYAFVDNVFLGVASLSETGGRVLSALGATTYAFVDDVMSGLDLIGSSLTGIGYASHDIIGGGISESASLLVGALPTIPDGVVGRVGVAASMSVSDTFRVLSVGFESTVASFQSVYQGTNQRGYEFGRLVGEGFLVLGVYPEEIWNQSVALSKDNPVIDGIRFVQGLTKERGGVSLTFRLERLDAFSRVASETVRPSVLMANASSALGSWWGTIVVGVDDAITTIVDFFSDDVVVNFEKPVVVDRAPEQPSSVVAPISQAVVTQETRDVYRYITTSGGGVSAYDLTLAIGGLRDELRPLINLAMLRPREGDSPSSRRSSGGNSVDLSGYLQLVGGDLTGALSGTDATFSGNLSVEGTLADSDGDVGSVGDVLQSTSVGTDWVATSTLGLSIDTSNFFSLSEWYATTTDALDEGLSNFYYSDARVASYIASSSTIPHVSGVSGDVLQWDGSGWVSVATSSLGISGITDHGLLTGLSDDDHTQYALLAGRSGGQTLVGGTGASDTLTLDGSLGTSGALVVGASGALLAPDGNATTPAYSFANATGIGIYNGGGNELSFDGGSHLFTINSSNLLNLVSNKVNLGSAVGLNWGTIGGSMDVGLSRISAGILGVTNGSSGGGALYANYFNATSTTATSTFAGRIISPGIVGGITGSGILTLDGDQTVAGSASVAANGVISYNATQNTGSISIGPMNYENLGSVAYTIGADARSGQQGMFLATGGSLANLAIRNLFLGTGSTDWGGTFVALIADGANALAQRNSTNAQNFRLYGTYTDTNNYERFTASTTQGTGVVLGMETAGTGADNLHIILSPAGTGNVGIGTTSPYAKLSVVGPVVAESFNATLTTATSTFAGVLYTAGSFADSTGSKGVNGMVLQSTNTGVQWVATSSLGISGITDHGLLTGLSDDDHTQYALLAGRSGGQTLVGGTGATDDLVLDGSAATAGSVTVSEDGDINVGGLLSVRHSNVSAPYYSLATFGSASTGYLSISQGDSVGRILNFFYGSDMGLSNGSSLLWSDSTDGALGTVDTGLSRISAGILGVTNGSSGGGALMADYLSATSTTATSTFAGGMSVAGSSGLTVLQNGKVGIGTTSPEVIFQIASTTATDLYAQIKTPVGTLNWGLWNNASNDVNYYQGNHAFIGTGGAANIPFGIRAGGAERITILNTGNVGVGTTSPWRNFSTVGTVGFSSTLSAEAGSDNYLCIDPVTYEVTNGGANCGASSERFKENIVDLAYGLDEVKALRPVNFTYKREITPDGSTHIGLIAEEVAQIVPEVVEFDEDGKPESVSYDNLVALLIKAVQELSDKVDVLLASAGQSISGGVARFVDAVVDRLTVGSAEEPSGITLFDDVTGEPYCLSVHNGATVTRAGACDTQPLDEPNGDGSGAVSASGSTTSDPVVDEPTTDEPGGDEPVVDATTPENPPAEEAPVVVEPPNETPAESVGDMAPEEPAVEVGA